MAVNEADALFGRINELLKELALLEDEGLDGSESVILADIQEKFFGLWEVYLDRLVEMLATNHPDPETAVALAGENVEELQAIRDRVRAKLINRGIPLGKAKKTQLH